MNKIFRPDPKIMVEVFILDPVLGRGPALQQLVMREHSFIPGNDAENKNYQQKGNREVPLHPVSLNFVQ